MRVMTIYRQSGAARPYNCTIMPLFSRSLLIAVCAWELSVVGSFLTALALSGTHIWSRSDLVWITGLAIWGLLVVGVIALLSRRFGRLGGAILGLLCGLLPSVLLLTWVFVAQPGFEASAGSAGFAYTLAALSSVGGMLAGIICSARKRPSSAS